MKAETKTIIKTVGLLLHVPGVMALISLPICWYFQEYYAFSPFGITALVSIGCGQLLYQGYRQAKRVQQRQAMTIVALGWLLIFLVGAIPFLGVASALVSSVETTETVRNFQDPLNALFESFSGFTSTGLTVAIDSSALPHCLQWWRSFMQWIGGVGLIVLTLTIFNPGENTAKLYQAEGWEREIGDSIQDTARYLWLIYVGYTIFSIVLFGLVGMPWWEAVNHGMTAIATGGFAITGNSFRAYDSQPLIQIAALLIMILGAISFATHWQMLVQRNFSNLWQKAVMQTFWLLLLFGSLAMLGQHYWATGELAWRDSIFQWISALTTCGFAVVKEETWSTSAQLLMALGMFFGAVSGSTVGGIKLNRVVILTKSVGWHLRLIFFNKPEELRYRLNGEWVSQEDAHRQLSSVAVVTFLWLIFIAVGVVILVHLVPPSYTLTNVIFEVTSAIGTSGLGTGITSPSLHPFGKVTLMLLMWFGRLEIVAVLVFMSWFVYQIKLLVVAEDEQEQDTEEERKDSEQKTENAITRER